MNEQQQLAEPQQGGSYVRNEDGTLERVAFTAPAAPRDKREASDNPPESADPGTASSAVPGGASSGTQE